MRISVKTVLGWKIEILLFSCYLSVPQCMLPAPVVNKTANINVKQNCGLAYRPIQRRLAVTDTSKTAKIRKDDITQQHTDTEAM